MTDIGPVQLLAIGFGPEAEYKGQIMDELERLEGKGLVRVLDLLFVGVDVDTGDLMALDYQGDDLGAVVGALLGFAFPGLDEVTVKVEASAGRESVGITRPQLEQLLRAVPPDVAIGLVLLEHVWARDLKRAIREAGAVPLAEGFLSPEVLADIKVEVAEVARLLDELEREEAAAAAT